jgi:hypothetical protein
MMTQSRLFSCTSSKRFSLQSKLADVRHFECAEKLRREAWFPCSRGASGVLCSKGKPMASTVSLVLSDWEFQVASRARLGLTPERVERLDDKCVCGADLQVDPGTLCLAALCRAALVTVVTAWSRSALPTGASRLVLKSRLSLPASTGATASETSWRSSLATSTFSLTFRSFTRLLRPTLARLLRKLSLPLLRPRLAKRLSIGQWQLLPRLSFSRLLLSLSVVSMLRLLSFLPSLSVSQSRPTPLDARMTSSSVFLAVAVQRGNGVMATRVLHGRR